MKESFPKPGHIRECGEGSQHREEYLGVPQLKYPDVDPAERAKALNDPHYLELKKKIHEVAKKKTIRVITAKPDRVKELNEQAKYILEKYPAKTA